MKLILIKIEKEIKIPVQGGMDPKVLLTDKENLKKYYQLFEYFQKSSLYFQFRSWSFATNRP